MSLRGLLLRLHSPSRPTPRLAQYLFSGLIGTILGYKYAYQFCDDHDYSSFLTPYTSQEQQYHLIHTTHKPILLLFYMPGESYSLYARPHLLRTAQQLHPHCHFMMINCAQSYELVQTRELKSIPQIELLSIQDDQLVSIRSNKDFTQEGISAFLEEQGIVPPFRYSSAYHQSALSSVHYALTQSFQ